MERWLLLYMLFCFDYYVLVWNKLDKIWWVVFIMVRFLSNEVYWVFLEIILYFWFLGFKGMWYYLGLVDRGM